MLLCDVLRQPPYHDGVVRSIVLPVILTRRGLSSVSLSPRTPISVSASSLTIILSISAPASAPTAPSFAPGPGAGPGARPATSPVSPPLATPVSAVSPLSVVILSLSVVVLAVGRSCRRWRWGLVSTPGMRWRQTDHGLRLGHEDGVLVSHLTTTGQQDGSVGPGSVHGSVGIELGRSGCCGLGCSVLRI